MELFRALPKEMLDTPQLQFAIKALKAVKTNNHAAFFRLFDEADLLQACCLHRCVARVRFEVG
jgi:SAC3/GANP family